jgi:hypothetical protein
MCAAVSRANNNLPSLSAAAAGTPLWPGLLYYRLAYKGLLSPCGGIEQFSFDTSSIMYGYGVQVKNCEHRLL